MKMTTVLTWNGDKLKTIAHKCMGASVEEMAITVATQAKLFLAGTAKSGMLRGSINWQMMDKGSPLDPGIGPKPKGFMEVNKPNQENVAFVGTTVFYGPYVEYGTGPHEIRIKKAKVLTDGKNFFGKVVQHPGTEAVPFMRPAIDMMRGQALKIIEKNGKNYFKAYLSETYGGID
jgi:hypothetical protein